MKPPHGNRPGGPGGRGGRDGGRGFGQGADRGRDRGQRPSGEGQGHYGGRDFGNRDFRGRGSSDRPSGEGGRDDRRQDGPRREGRPFGKPRGEQHGPHPGRDQGREHGRDRNFEHRPRHQNHHHGPRRGPEAPRGTVWLYGQHAVAAALANTARRLRRLALTEEAEATLAQRLPPPWPLQPERVDRGRLDHLLGRDLAHQGAALLADPLPPPSLQQILDRPGPLIVLDQVTDPRNVGAILRSAAAFGAAAVIAQERNAPEETGALAKAASGALETMPLLRAVNIARTLIALKAANIWVVGLDTSGATRLAGPAFAGRRVAIVLGAEGEGLRRLTRETCDEVARLEMPGKMESLNVSAAATVALYELARQPS